MLRITLAQLNLTVGDIEGNVTRMIATAQQAAAAQADIVVFSELSLCAYYPGDKSPLDTVASVKVPVLGLYGGADGGIPNESVEKYFAALKTAGNARSAFVIYPETPHAFHADYRPTYRKDKAEDGWKRAVEWFKQHLA